MYLSLPPFMSQPLLVINATAFFDNLANYTSLFVVVKYNVIKFPEDRID